MTMDRERLLMEAVDCNRDRFVALLQNLIHVAKDGEDAVQRQIAIYLAKLGVRVEELKYRPRELQTDYELALPDTVDPTEHTVAVGQVLGSDGARSMLLFAHPDSEPVQGTDEWQHDPFAGDTDGDQLYGWGVGDDLVGIATGLAAIDTLVTSGLMPKGDVLFASTPSKKRAQGILAALDHRFDADAALYLHPAESGAGLEDIKSVTSGLLRFRIVVEGKLPDTHEPVHTPFVHTAVDPLSKAFLIYGALQRLNHERGESVTYAPLEERIGRSTNLHIAHLRYGNEDKLERISPSCTLAGSLTFPPGEEVRDVQAQVTAAINAESDSDVWLREHPPQITFLFGTNGAEVPPENPFYQAIVQAVEGHREPVRNEPFAHSQ